MADSPREVPGPDSILRWHLTSIGNPIVATRRSYDRLISTMGFPILVRWHLYIETGPQLRGKRTWWRHQMETFSALLALCAGNSSVTGEFPSQRPVTRSFDISFYLCLNKRLSKQSWSWWFETPSRSLGRQCNDFTDLYIFHNNPWVCSSARDPDILIPGDDTDTVRDRRHTHWQTSRLSSYRSENKNSRSHGMGVRNIT